MHHDQLILKSLTGNISDAEKRQLDAWISESAENKKAYDDFTSIWKLSGDNSDLKNFGTEQEWMKFESTIARRKVRAGSVQQFSRFEFNVGLKIAASIAFTALFSFVLYLTFFNHKSTLIETGATMNRVALPDGSAVWLNHHSSLSYSTDFNKDSRPVELEGEAFFEVKKDPEKPFIVRLNNAEVKVLGTSFNINAYKSDEAIKVYVATGSVSLSHESGPAAVTLKPGEMGTMLRNAKQISLSAEENLNALAWKEKKLIFKKTSLSNVVKNLEDYFDIDIQVKSEDILKCRFTGSFDRPGVNEVIEALSVSLDLTITKSGAVYNIDGDGC